MAGKRVRSIAILLAGAACAALPPAALAQDRDILQFDLPAQDLGDALRTVAAKAGWELYASAEDVNGVAAPRIQGELTARQAIEQLLAGTSLRARFTKGAVIIRGRSVAAVAEDVGEAEIVVTGSRIQGARASVPAMVIERDDMRRSGQADLGEVARSLPQNFGGGQNPGIGNNQGAFNENANVNGASTFNLRGIGPNATLTLLNGNRFSYSGINSVIDISAIPVSVIEKVDIVADGASAIYGADAVAGVVNILLRRDYDGVSTTARLGGSTDGGNFQQQYGVLGGMRWAGGGFVAAYDFSRNSAIEAGDRSYATANNPNNTLYPALKRHSVLLSGHQELTPGLRFTTDLIYKRGDTSTLRGTLINQPVTVRGLDAHTDFKTFGVAPKIEAELGKGWTGSISGFYGTDATDGVTLNYTAAVAARSTRRFFNRNLAIEAGVQGPIFMLPAGDVRLAAGGGWRENRLDVDLSGRSFAPQRTNSFAYTELFVPLASPEQANAFVHRASLTAALRWEDYSDSGQIVTPKLGLSFSPAKALTLGLSWGRSFKLPTLYQQYSGYSAVLLPITGYGSSFPAGTNFLYLVGPSPDVGPERSENWTLSATLQPSSRLTITTSFFNIDYKDRVAPPFASPFGILTDPIYWALITTNPGAALLDAAIAGANGPLQNFSGGAYTPTNTAVLLDGRDLNIAVQRYRGADLSIRYKAPLSKGQSLTLTADGSLLESRQQLLPGLPQTDLSGTIFNPPTFRGRGGISFDSRSFTLSTFISHSGGVMDRRRSVPVRVSAVTTVDLTGSVRIRDFAQVSISALNILNAKPDAIYVATPADGPFDTTNYSATGRFLGITISRDW